jgi:hypothetical protein
MFKEVAPALDHLLAQINAAFPNRSKISDGGLGNAAHAARESDHNPDGNGIVHARDFTHDPDHGFDSYKFAGQLLKCNDTRLKYVISNGRIGGGPGYYSGISGYCPQGIKPGTWTPYKGPNLHTHHVHVSVEYDQSAFSVRDWNVPMLLGEDMPLSDEDFQRIAELPLSDENVKRIAKAVVNMGVVSGSNVIPFGLAAGRAAAGINRVELNTVATNAAVLALKDVNGLDDEQATAVVRKAVEDALGAYTLSLQKDVPEGS